eukprot:scaffold156800_cov28-Tisochrysis_lutea.AAC.2
MTKGSRLHLASFSWCTRVHWRGRVALENPARTGNLSTCWQEAHWAVISVPLALTLDVAMTMPGMVTMCATSDANIWRILIGCLEEVNVTWIFCRSSSASSSVVREDMIAASMAAYRNGKGGRLSIGAPGWRAC